MSILVRMTHFFCKTTPTFIQRLGVAVEALDVECRESLSTFDLVRMAGTIHVFLGVNPAGKIVSYPWGTKYQTQKAMLDELSVTWTQEKNVPWMTEDYEVGFR